jgi:hypothetical protein
MNACDVSDMKMEMLCKRDSQGAKLYYKGDTSKLLTMSSGE